MFNPKKILVTTDFSGESDNALKTALDIAEKFSSEVFLMHVLEDISTITLEYLPIEDFNAMNVNLKESVLEKLKDEIAKVSSGKGVAVKEIVPTGDPVDQIMDEINEKKIDLLVVAPHKRHRPWNLFFSHLSNEIVKKSSCQTLLVKN
jgi:nucleotide-binding universal stress UspA family protein